MGAAFSCLVDLGWQGPTLLLSLQLGSLLQQGIPSSQGSFPNGSFQLSIDLFEAKRRDKKDSSLVWFGGNHLEAAHAR